MVEQCCGTCVFFRRMNEEAGECRRMPPQVVVLQQSGVQPVVNAAGMIGEQKVIVQKPTGVFPALKVDDPGCGEYLVVRDEAGEMLPPGPEAGAPAKVQTMHD